MLVLSRKKDESIVINDDITIVVVEIRGDKVRLGIEAPKEVPVHRREVFEAIVEPTGTAGPEGSASEGSVLQQASLTSGRERADDTARSGSASEALVSTAPQAGAGLASAAAPAVDEEGSPGFAQDKSGRHVSDENEPSAASLRKSRPR